MCTDRLSRKMSLVSSRLLLRVRILRSCVLLLVGRVRLMIWTPTVVITLVRVRRPFVKFRPARRRKDRWLLWNLRSLLACSLLWTWRAGVLPACVIWKVRPIVNRLVGPLRWLVPRMLLMAWRRWWLMAVLLSFSSICLLVPITRGAFV